jgi:hypothetical protein
MSPREFVGLVSRGNECRSGIVNPTIFHLPNVQRIELPQKIHRAQPTPLFPSIEAPAGSNPTVKASVERRFILLSLGIAKSDTDHAIKLC